MQDVRYPYCSESVYACEKTVKNQITLPKAIIEKLPKTDYFEVSIRGEEIVLRPVVIEAKGDTARKSPQ